VDPFAEKRSPWPKVVVAVLILIATCAILNKLGFIYDWTHGRLGDPRPKAETAHPMTNAPAGAAAKQAEATK
jgi:hypothetical protein